MTGGENSAGVVIALVAFFGLIALLVGGLLWPWRNQADGAIAGWVKGAPKRCIRQLTDAERIENATAIARQAADGRHPVMVTHPDGHEWLIFEPRIPTPPQWRDPDVHPTDAGWKR